MIYKVYEQIFLSLRLKSQIWRMDSFGSFIRATQESSLQFSVDRSYSAFLATGPLFSDPSLALLIQHEMDRFINHCEIDGSSLLQNQIPIKKLDSLCVP